MRAFISRLRSLIRESGRSDRLASEMHEEMRFHVEMEAERLVRERGLTPGEARRQAHVAFGGMERYKAEGRDVRGTTRVADFSLDIKLGARMLAKYPAVTIVGGLAMAIGIGLGAAYLEIVNDFLRPSLPFDEGHRIVGLQNWDATTNKPELRSTQDFLAWRDALTSVEDLGAFRSIERNLGPPNALAEPALGAEISPSAFRMVRVAPVRGRPLMDADAHAGAPPVIVLGYHLWRSRFFGDAAILGRDVQLGKSTTTVVGVMPEGFAFPVSHQFWVPLREDASSYARRDGPPIQVFGRLAPGVSLDEAQAELSALGARAAADSPGTHEHLRPRVVKYVELFVGGQAGPQAYLASFIFITLLLVLASNVATMVFARTASRENEIAMRFALGSTRRRILGQFFIEALVLALAATALGLAVVAFGTQWITRLLWEVTGGQVPFWLDSRLNLSTVAYALVLAVLGSLVAGVLPAFKATGSRLQARLRHASGNGRSAMKFGGVWSALIVVQAAFAVLILPPAMLSVSSLAGEEIEHPGFAADQYLAARIEMDLEHPSPRARSQAEFFAEFDAMKEELRTRLLGGGEISRVAFASRLPGMNHPEPSIDMETDGGIVGVEPAVMPAAVDPYFFDAFGARIVAGRGFTSADRGAAVAVVNEMFVTEILEGRNAVGRRVRYSTRAGQMYATGEPRGVAGPAAVQPGDWFEIVGVVSNLGMDTNADALHSGTGPGIYHPLTEAAMGSGGSYSVRLAFQVRGDAAALAPQLRQIAQAVHPSLRIYDVATMDGPVDRAAQTQRLMSRMFTWITALVAVIALFISTAGMYSVMSFTVWRQTRDIGIRIALGANRARIVSGVFSRAMIQIGAGLVVGAALWVYFIAYELRPSTDGGADEVRFLFATAALLMLVGLLACGVPVRRALRIEPTEALRDVG